MTGSERGTKGSWERGGQRREEDATEEGVLHTRREKGGSAALQSQSTGGGQRTGALAHWDCLSTAQRRLIPSPLSHIELRPSALA